MDITKSPGRLFYEELRLLTKDTFEAIQRLNKICTVRNTHYVFVNDHIGDVIISLGYLRAYRDKMQLGNVTIVITEKYAKLAECYADDYDEVKLIPQYDLYRIFLLNSTTFGQKLLIRKYSNVLFINPADSARIGFDYLKCFPDITLEKMIKYGCYCLDDKAMFRPLPQIESKSQSKQKCALLLLEARTVDLEAASVLEAIVPELRRLGYQIYTNTRDKDSCVKYTTPIYLEISELREFVNDGVLIGVRSGLHDLLQYQGCKVIAMYPYEYGYGNLFSLKMMPETRSDNLEVYLTGDDEIDRKKIINFVRGKRSD